MNHLKLKPSKYADFMMVTKVHTPKYKFRVEVGGLEHEKTILLIMGIGAQYLAWPTEFCKTLIDGGYRVIRFDNRDIGKSSKMKHKNDATKHFTQPLRQMWLASRFQMGLPNHKLPLPYDLHDMAEDVRQLLLAMDISQCHVVGMSMGGMIAQILAATQPDLVEKLGLVATSNNRPFLRPPNPIHVLPTLKKTKSKDEKAAVEQIYKTLKAVSSKPYFDAQLAREKAQAIYRRRFYPKGTRRHLLAVLATGSLRKLNQQIQQPALILHGEKDKIIPIAHGRSVAKSIAGSEFVAIPDMGHEIPEALAAHLGGLLLSHFG